MTNSGLTTVKEITKSCTNKVIDKTKSRTSTVKEGVVSAKDKVKILFTKERPDTAEGAGRDRGEGIDGDGRRVNSTY